VAIPIDTACYRHYHFASFGLTIDPLCEIAAQTFVEGLAGAQTPKAASKEKLLNQQMLKARGNILRNHVRNQQGGAVLRSLCGDLAAPEDRA
jgi:hypothetical protein